MNEEAKINEKIAKISQRCFQQHPIVILGSGASIIHGIRGMDALSKYLIDNVDADHHEERGPWEIIKESLESGDGLEDILQKTPIPLSLAKKIVTATWAAIAEDDIALMHRVAIGEERFALSDLISGMFNSTHKIINIVTTNYDRVAEYAVDSAGYYHTTGFVPGIIRSREGHVKSTYRRGAYSARTVRIWKVHGSLDWFTDPTGRVLCLPVMENLLNSFDPLIVTPGVSKYEKTHDEPFRSAIHGADGALEEATSFLCVGYGFRDRHIQPKIVDRCSQRNVPIVILARTLTEEARRFLTDSAGRAYMALEKNGTGSRVFLPEYPHGLIVAQPDLWTFESFNKIGL